MPSISHHENIVDFLDTKELIDSILDKFIEVDKAKGILPFIVE